MRPGPPGAESAPLNASALFVPHAVLTRFVEEGFRYVGRVRLVHEFAPPRGAAGSNRSAAAEPETTPDGRHWKVKAARCTPDGDMYIGR